MARFPIPLGFSHYQTAVKPLSSQRCINWIPTVSEGPALSQVSLMQPPGLTVFSETGYAGNRGGTVVAGVPYFVNGTQLISLASDGTQTDHGTITGSNRVSMANNGRYLVIVVPGSFSYVFDNTDSSLTQITDADFITADTVVFKDGYFVFSASDGSVFFNSLLNQPLSFDALDFGTAEINPDKIVALHVNHNELFVCGEETIEIFQNVGGAGFPFQRIPGANIQKGVYAKHSLVEFDNTFCFIGGGLNEEAAIWKVSGSSSANKISTDAIDQQLQKFTRDEIADAFSYTMALNGQFVAVFTVESSRIPSKTFAYNATASALAGAKVWFELQTGLDDDRFRVQCVVSVYNKLLVGDDRAGKVGYLDGSALTHYGDPILRSSTSQPFSQNGLPVFAGDFEATFEAGVGLTGGLDPQAQLEYSDDMGGTFPNRINRSIGKIGEYGQRAVWQRQGRFPVARTIRLSVTDPVKANLIRLAATAEIGV